jgi:mRNA-degrading endonuclease RelE of RelBE toxin-antitoxin system
VIVAISKSYENVVKELHKYYRAWLKKKVDIVKKKFDGKQMVVVTASFSTDELKEGKKFREIKW